MNLQFFGIYRFKEWCKFQFIVLLFITQIAWNSNGLAAEPGRDMKVGNAVQLHAIELTSRHVVGK